MWVVLGKEALEEKYIFSSGYLLLFWFCYLFGVENMRLLSVMGNSFGCSASGERLVSAAREGDLLEARALLEYNPRLARYCTFGVRNSPLHYSASHGHHEIVFLLLEAGVNINLRNTRGQTALMQACQYGHWEVVQTLMLFKANIHKTDYLNGGTAIHFAAINGHSRCIRLLLADHVPSIPDFWNIMRRRSNQKVSKVEFDDGALSRIVNQKADGGITALHMAALNGHAETVQLLLDLGAGTSEVTVEDGTTIDLIGAGSTPLHYAACGGNAQCCQILISRGASLTAKNANGWTPMMVAISWHRNWLEGVLNTHSDGHVHIHPSPYLSLPLMSIMKIARKSGWRDTVQSPVQVDPCVVCLERKCTVAAEGCGHEFCTRCALYLCSTNPSATTSGPPGSIPCPLCRHAIVSFFKLPSKSPMRELQRSSLSLSICATGATTGPLSASSTMIKSPLCKPELYCSGMPSLRSSSLRYIGCQKFPITKLGSSLCMRASDTSPSLVRSPRSRLRRPVTQEENRRPWLFSLNQYVTAIGS